MSIVRNFNLYLNAGNGSAPYINVNQYDQGEQWVFTLYKEDGTKYTPSTGAIVGIKADNRGIINTGTVDADGRVVINETQQMTAAAGIAIFELLIDGDSHGTANFLVNVERRPGDNADLSDSDLSLIQQAVDSAAVIIEVIGDSDPSEVIGEHVDDWLDNHPEATTTVLDGAITAPKLNNSLWDKLLVNEEASGAVASFDDGADDVPVSSLKVALEPIQTGSGDPSPTNVRPIIAANGKNLFTVTQTTQTLDGVTVTINADGTINLAGTSTAVIALVLGYFTPTANTSYYVSGSPFATNSCRLQFQEGSTTVANQYNNESVLVENLNETQHRIRLYIANGTNVDGVVIKPMIRLASITDASYQPYQGITVERTGKNLFNISLLKRINTNTFRTSDFPLKAGTYTFSRPSEDNGLYSWYVRKRVGSLFENLVTGGQSFASGTFTINEDIMCYVEYYASTGIADSVIKNIMIEVGGTVTEYAPFINTSYPYSLGQSVYGGTVDLVTGVLTVTDGYIASYNGETLPSTWISDRDVYASGTTPTTGAQVVYKLATPQTINLTPTQVKTLLGYNNISSSGTVDVIYHADTKLYVDKMTAVDNNIIAPTEQTFTATRNYTVNDLVIVNDTLYKVTANIATGSAITPNSNVTQTTLSALIKALS